MKYSVIIPFKEDNRYLDECVGQFTRVPGDEYEIILLPDDMSSHKGIKIRVIPTGPVGPAEKRDIGAEHACGDVLAFIDDDAYPHPEWLKNAGKYFNSEVVAVGGPGVTPDSDSLSQKVSGYIFESLIGGGGMTYRYKPGSFQEVDDYPSCNLLIKRDIFKQLGGFDTNFWPGEDTKLCLDLTKKLKKKMVYAPDVVVYHHRRMLFNPHLQQVWRYATHRGHFARILPDTSLRAHYFLPSILFVGILVGWLPSVMSHIWFILYVFGLFLYGAAVILTAFVGSVELRSFSAFPLIIAGIIMTHFCYGIGFLKGLFFGGMKR